MLLVACMARYRETTSAIAHTLQYGGLLGLKTCSCRTKVPGLFEFPSRVFPIF